MISVDTNVIVRLLTGDDPKQHERSKTLFSTDTIFIPTSVVLECEWVLRYAYNFKQPEITSAFQSLFGLQNVQLENPHEISNAIEWHQNGMDFADAIHLALSEEAEAFFTFDKSLVKPAKKNTTIPVREP
ncbi:MAG: type II toxin-antitoxin system VapC family toxin [Desulfobacteraceae bacterium]|nr:type II toxin-antitoxin system VapC family toxin [Desulfobacteraceae bacterium]